MSKPAKALRLVDPDTGEISEELNTCVHCQGKDDEIKGLQSTIKGWMRKYANLKRDKEAEAEADAMWPEAAEVFLYWRKECSHPNCEWSYERFEEVRPMLKRYGRAACEQAIRGAAFDPFQSTRKNGTTKRFDDFELIMRSSAKFEEFASRAPAANKPKRQPRLTMMVYPITTVPSAEKAKAVGLPDGSGCGR